MPMPCSSWIQSRALDNYMHGHPCLGLPECDHATPPPKERDWVWWHWFNFSRHFRKLDVIFPRGWLQLLSTVTFVSESEIHQVTWVGCTGMPEAVPVSPDPLFLGGQRLQLNYVFKCCMYNCVHYTKLLCKENCSTESSISVRTEIDSVVRHIH